MNSSSPLMSFSSGAAVVKLVRQAGTNASKLIYLLPAELNSGDGQESNFLSKNESNSQRFRTYSSESQSSGYASSHENGYQSEEDEITKIVREPDFPESWKAFVDDFQPHGSVVVVNQPVSGSNPELPNISMKHGNPVECYNVNHPAIKMEPVSFMDAFSTTQKFRVKLMHANDKNINEPKKPVGDRPMQIFCNVNVNQTQIVPGIKMEPVSHPDIDFNIQISQEQPAFTNNVKIKEPKKTAKGRPRKPPPKDDGPKKTRNKVPKCREGKDPVNCRVCGKPSRDKTASQMHELTHTDIKPFACSVPGCPQRFRQNVHRIKHESAKDPSVHKPKK